VRPKTPFTPHCKVEPAAERLPRFELVRTPPEQRWLWACRAVALFGAPKPRSSGYLDFTVRDSESGACMTLSIEEQGAFVYDAPEGRGAALRTALESASTADCSFQLLSGSRPLKVGIRGGRPFEEPLFDLESIDGARAFFEARPDQESAANLLSRYLVLDPKARPPGIEPVIERALAVEMDQFDQMEVGWLSDVGKEGYCQRSKDLQKLSVSPPLATRVAGQVKRFCKR
jgi:hypothetical protein